MAQISTKRRIAESGGDSFAAMASVASHDKRFLGQLEATKKAAEGQDWRGVTLGCRMLYRIAMDGEYLDKIEPVLRPLFESAKEKFEESRRVARVLRARVRTAARKLKQLARLAYVLQRAA